MRPKVREDIRALAAIRDADAALVILERAIYELCPDNADLQVKFYGFADVVASKLSTRLSKAALKDVGNNRGNYRDTTNITTWILRGNNRGDES